MTYEEARDEAKRIWGTLDWSPEKGFFVTGGYEGARLAHWWEQPWGEWGFFPDPWANYIKTAAGEVVLATPQISWAAQQELGWSQQPLPSGFEAIKPTYEQQTQAVEDEAAWMSYRGYEGAEPYTIREWIAAGRPKSPAEAAGLGKPAVTWDTVTDPDTGMTVMVGYDEDGNIVQYEPQGWAPAGRAEPTEWEREQAEWERQWAEQQMAQEAALQEQLLGYYRERDVAQLEAERQQRLAQLAAQPMSWLQYAAEAGTQPVVQPWMLPLMPQQYSQLQAGAQIPGYQGTEGMTGMPSLLRPGAQYQARMGPTALQQYYGYQQAQTGALPGETQFRRWSEAPPAGRFPGLSYRR